MIEVDDEFLRKLKAHAKEYLPVVHFEKNIEALTHIDLSENNANFKKVNASDLEEFQNYISQEL
ncbi:MAG: hypothetical protein ABI683_12785, partial [Ginsengibacter sp.]